MSSSSVRGGLAAHSDIIKNISRFYDSDCRVADYFKLAQPESPLFDETSGKPLAKAECSEANYKYEKGTIVNDRILQSDLIQYPVNIRHCISEATSRVFIGYFQHTKIFYCIADSHLLLWSEKSSNETTTQIDANGFITACDITYPNSEAFETKNISYLLIYSTEDSVNIVPVGKNGKYYVRQTVSTHTSFIPTAIRTSTSPTNYSIFIGSNSGDVFGLFYKLNQTTANLEITIKNLSSNIFLALLPKFLRYSHQIVDICYDETTSFLAALDSMSNLRFFKYNNNSLTEVSHYEPQTEGASKEKIVSISSVPISDSDCTRFVCITEDGERLLFGTNPGVFLNDEIHRLQKLYVPRQFLGFPVAAGGYFLNTSVFMYRNSISFIKPVYRPHQQVINPSESYELFDIDSTALNFVGTTHPYANQTFRLFYHELMWEHITPSPECYLMCTDGYYKFTMCRPVDTLRTLVEDFRGNFSDPIREWMQFYGEEAESAAAVLLFATEFPASQRWALSILHQYSSLVMKNRTQYDTSLSPTCAAFIQRSARLLSIIWQTPVIAKEKGKFVLSKTFRKLPPTLNKDLQALIDVSAEYIKVKRALSELNSVEQRKEDTAETNLFNKLCSYLKNVIEILNFIGIVSRQAKLIDAAMNDMKEPSRIRLSEEAFGSEVQQISLFEALREFAGSLLKQDRNLYQVFAKECPTFFSFEDLQIIDITNRLSNSIQPPASLLEKAREIYLKYINQPFKLDGIVSLFQQNQFTKGIVDVCLKKANSVDPMQHALQWYRGDRSSEDMQGRAAFDARYECYEFVFDLIDDEKAEKMMKASNDELFHVCLYHRMLNTGKIDKLLSFNTPYVSSFLEEYAPDHLWIYNSRNNDYAKSATQLLSMTSDKEKQFPLQQRIQWLRYIISLARADGANGLQNEAKSKLALANIQLELKNRQGMNCPEYLMEPQSLFDTCCQNGQWDLVLKIIANSPITGENKIKVISKVWTNYLDEQLWNENLGIAAARIADTFTDISSENDVCDPNITIPVLEEHRLRKDGNELWAVHTMINAKFDKHLILAAYLTFLQNPDLSDEIKFDFIYSVAYLIDNGANPRGRNLTEIKKFFLEKARKCKYYYKAARIMSNF